MQQSNTPESKSVQPSKTTAALQEHNEDTASIDKVISVFDHHSLTWPSSTYTRYLKGTRTKFYHGRFFLVKAEILYKIIITDIQDKVSNLLSSVFTREKRPNTFAHGFYLQYLSALLC